MSLLCKIEPCLTTLFEFIDIKQLHCLFLLLCNHELKDKIQFQLNYIKQTNVIYVKLLKSRISKNIIHQTPIVFFQLNSFLKKYRNFKKYIFNLFERSDIHGNIVFIANCRYQLYFCKKIDKNTIIMLHNVNKDEHIYYSIFEDKINFNNESKYGKNYCGYLIYNNKYNEENIQLLNNIF
jgi:hypothetical protein